MAEGATEKANYDGKIRQQRTIKRNERRGCLSAKSAKWNQHILDTDEQLKSQ